MRNLKNLAGALVLAGLVLALVPARAEGLAGADSLPSAAAASGAAPAGAATAAGAGAAAAPSAVPPAGSSAAVGAAAAASAVTAAGSSLAAGTAAPAAAVGLAEARSLALARSAVLKKAALALDSAALAEKGLRLSSLPSIAAQGGSSLSLPENPGISLSLGVSAQQKLYDGGKSALALEEAGLGTEAARAELLAARLAVMQSADQAYYAVLQADAAVESAVADLGASRTALELAQGSLAAGSATKTEVLKAQSDLAAKVTAEGQAQAARKTAMARLASVTGLESGTALAPVDSAALAELIAKVAAMDDTAVEALVAKVYEAAVQADATLAGLGLSTRKAGIEVAIAKAASLPSVSAGASLSIGARAGFSSGGSLAATASGSLSLSASMPLDLWNARISVEKAELAARSPGIETADRLSALDLEVRTAVYAWTSQAQSVRSAQVALDFARATYDNTLEAYRLRSVPQSDLSTAQASVATARRQLDQSRYSFLASVTALRSLAGLEEDALLIAMIP